MSLTRTCTHWARQRTIGDDTSLYRSCGTLTDGRTRHMDSTNPDKVDCDLCRIDIRNVFGRRAIDEGNPAHLRLVK